ncbi:hypothetical protein [Bacillus sp. OK048]|uniref:hypothetical protein n=1 Tax=Bacillus sp. OK048 TaxID=1882761 RepID=UPI00088BCE1D|nr:hypothetical protein [Bacillus sp. OK048]SDL95097.1 hypothetical protein SAMN05443253_101262 [Bacillus sp. OK048]
MSEQERMLQYKTSTILEKDTCQMTLNDIIEELVHIIETKLANEQKLEKIMK